MSSCFGMSRWCFEVFAKLALETRSRVADIFLADLWRIRVISTSSIAPDALRFSGAGVEDERGQPLCCLKETRLFFR